MRFKDVILFTSVLMISAPAFCQTFEGIITIRTASVNANQTSVLTVKGEKSLLEVKVDSLEEIKVIKDRRSETTTILRRREDMRYGFRSDKLHGDYSSNERMNPAEYQITIKVISEHESIGNYNCTRVLLNGPDVTAEAWITNHFDFKLSTWFPEFLNNGESVELNNMRAVADQEGFIMRYFEHAGKSNDETEIVLNVEQIEIPEETLAVDTGYLVLDAAGMRRLYMESRQDSQKMVQWEEFRTIFGNK